MSQHIVYRIRYPGEASMFRRRFKRLASRVWQKKLPTARGCLRAIVDESQKTMKMTLVDTSPLTP